MQMKNRTQWNDLTKDIDDTFTVNLEQIPDQEMTAQEFRGFATDAGATFDENKGPLDELVARYGE